MRKKNTKKWLEEVGKHNIKSKIYGNDFFETFRGFLVHKFRKFFFAYENPFILRLII